MKKYHVLYEAGDHKWMVLHQDNDKKRGLLDSNEYVISKKGKHMLVDPGGFEIFPAVLSTLVQTLEVKDIHFVFSSHQDPDIASSLSLWQEIQPGIKCYVSWLWESFIPHFGGTKETFIPIPDPGMKLQLEDLTLECIPAHHLHSAGNFHLYDPLAKILFTGDMGAALYPEGEGKLFVEDFNEHLPYIEGFHRRWFGSNEHKMAWIERVKEMDIEIMCPQHGSIYRRPQVKQFIDWLSKLNVGTTSNRGSVA